ncbi:CHASE2 domain-containing protein [Coralloluteibacterium stylophorae]|uniref:CHASE2 domain-containing protein n=1 Tax=Coralloluteibacterium stylophorae TaxID=1776034 RepID=A0A8J8AWV2_9GAMM|nr:CHASE2 domain-containing protein [Coralloluteibacterium stylophorae]MBS7457360.1 CHASE2 domain-containing protein [Coralloluteibacterium stylophorae]
MLGIGPLHPPAGLVPRASRRQGLLFLAAAVAIALAVGLAGLLRVAPVARLDNAVLDALTRATATDAAAPDTLVVDIDDVSLAAVGQWPWPRYRLAALLERIAAARPAAIALDILMPEADRTSLADIQQTFQRDFGIAVTIDGVPDGLRDNDGYLGHVMAAADVVGARYFYFDHATGETRPTRPGVGFDGALDALELDRAHGVLDNVDAIASQTRASGFVNMGVDDDGVLRRLPLLVEYRGVLHPSLALATTMRALDASSARVVEGRDGASLVIGSHAVPVDRRGRALLRFEGRPSRYRSVPAVEVLAGRHAPQDLRGKVVIVGASAVGLRDRHMTAVSPAFSGAQVQSALVQNILDGRALRAPAWGGIAALALGLVLALALGGLFLAGRRLLALTVASVGAVALLGALAYVAFARWGLVLPVAAPVLVAAIVLAVAFVTRFAMQQRHARRWRRQLENARQVTIESMSAVAETRDPETGAHIKRTQHYVRAIARRLRDTGQYAEVLTDEYIHLLFLSAPLHDIGKVGVPDHILLKPGPLTEEEWVVMRRHAEFGRKIILSTSQHIEGDNFLSVAAEIAASHHEKWDGTGYPAGLQGQAIPLSGRIMAVADIYDALVNRRCYKEPFPHAQAMDMMRQLRGATFDPVVLDAFFAIEDEITRIAAAFRDEEEAATGAGVAAADADADVVRRHAPARTTPEFLLDHDRG